MPRCHLGSMGAGAMHLAARTTPAQCSKCVCSQHVKDMCDSRPSFGTTEALRAVLVANKCNIGAFDVVTI